MTKHALKRPPTKLEDGTIEIHLTRGYRAYINLDHKDLALFNWQVSTVDHQTNTYYAQRSITIGKYSLYTEQLHRTILERILGRKLLPEEKVDHIDGNGLNCRESNIRLATSSQNSQNMRLNRNNKCGLKGVSWHKQHQKWRSQIKHGDKFIHLGYYATPELAYEAYCNAAIKYFGEFSRLG